MLVVMHRRTLYENVDSVKIKVTTDIDILYYSIVSSYIVSIYRSISMNRYTPNNNVQYVENNVFFNLKPRKHIAIHQIHKIMFFLATSYDPFK